MEGPDAVGRNWRSSKDSKRRPGLGDEILPNRISEYEPAWLDEQCLAGRFVWSGSAPAAATGARRGAGAATADRAARAAQYALWSTWRRQSMRRNLSASAQRVAQYLSRTAHLLR